MNTLYHRQPPSARRGKFAAGIGIGIILVIALGIVALFPPHQHLPPTGHYNTATARYTFIDQNRIEKFNDSGENRKVNVVFWFPENAKDGETYPLVVFSHGGLGTENSNETLYLELASHGYIVCSIGHPYHALWTKDEDGQVTFVSKEYFNDIQQEDAKSDKEQSYRFYREWMNIRAGDINFVIDTILMNATNNNGGVYALIDVTKIGVMGHSLGGSAALAIPRQRYDVAAVIALESPFLYDIAGVENGEFIWLDEEYPVPVLNIYSDSSWDHLPEWAQYARNYEFLSDAPAHVSNLYLPGRGHFSLTDLSLASPLIVRLLEGRKPMQGSEEYLKTMNEACLDFFDRYLKGWDG
jgi:pimeloyl-ACP methyl ester carboxylesterase